MIDAKPNFKKKLYFGNYNHTPYIEWQIYVTTLVWEVSHWSDKKVDKGLPM